MRVPIRRVKGTVRTRKETAEDALADKLEAHFAIERDKSFSYTDAAGEQQTLTVDITLPKEMMMVIIRKKQDTKGILAEMREEKIARAKRWGVCRLSEQEARGDVDDILYLIRREIVRERARHARPNI